MDDVKVTVVEFGDRACFQMQYRDPITGKKKTRSTGVERGGKRARAAAEKEAGKWEDDLRKGTYRPPSHFTWQDFRDRYEDEKLAGLAPRTDAKAQEVFGALETIVGPAKLADLTAPRLSYFQSKLRENGLAESTIAGMLAHLKASLNWAVKMGMLAKLPAIERPKRAKGSKVMKGRPITLEEFERMLDKVESVVGQPAAESWKQYLRGLWKSGLRLGESLELYWDRDDKLCADLTGKRPMLRIPAALEKGNKDRVLPMSPEFAEFLQAIPEAERVGRVFNPKSRWSKATLTSWSVGTTVSAIGKKAGVKVNTDAKGRVKFASAHDLRRSFGERWAARVMPQVLMELMRHESIDTTMRFYVGQNAERTADVLWQAHGVATGNSSGNTAPENTVKSA